MQTTTEKPKRPTRLGVDIFTTGQVSRLACVAPRTVSKWCDSGALPHYRIPFSQDRRILRADLKAFFVKQGMPDPFPQPPQTLLVGIVADVEDSAYVPSLFDLGLAFNRKAEKTIIVIDFATTGRREAVSAARRLRSEFPVSRLVLIALACEDEVAALSLAEAGFNTVLFAPVAPKVLREAIQAAMGEG